MAADSTRPPKVDATSLPSEPELLTILVAAASCQRSSEGKAAAPARSTPANDESGPAHSLPPPCGVGCPLALAASDPETEESSDCFVTCPTIDADIEVGTLNAEPATAGQKNDPASPPEAASPPHKSQQPQTPPQALTPQMATVAAPAAAAATVTTATTALETMTTHLSPSTPPLDESPPVGGSADRSTPKLLSLQRCDDHACSWSCCCCRVDCCQQYANAKCALLWLSLAGLVQGMIVNGFVLATISTIERRYDLKSADTGIIASSYDLASLACLLPVSYIGGRGRKMKWVSVGTFLMALGSLLYALPQFTAAPYERGGAGGFPAEAIALCSSDGGGAPGACDATLLSNYKYVFITGQLLHGSGASPLYTLGVTYLDDNLTAETKAVYIGGHILRDGHRGSRSRLLGWRSVSKYLHRLLSRKQQRKHHAREPSVGGRLVDRLRRQQPRGAGRVGRAVRLPASAAVRELRGVARRIRGVRRQRGHIQWLHRQPRRGTPGPKGSPLQSDVRLLVAGRLHRRTIAERGFDVRAEVRGVPVRRAGVVGVAAGFVAIPAGGGGTLLGGYLVKHFDMKCKAIVRMCLVLTAASFLFSFAYLVQCPNVPFAGVTEPYVNSSSNSNQLDSLCNADCHCTMDNYSPVCIVEDSVTFYSPCFAGCRRFRNATAKTNLAFKECACTRRGSATADPSEYDYEAVEGHCASSCQLLMLFLPLFLGVCLFTFLVSMPALIATLRCVCHSQKSFALGIQWALVRALGSIPAGPLYGGLIDRSCLLWHEQCALPADGGAVTGSGTGSCYLYDNASMATYILIATLGAKSLSCVFFYLAMVLYKAPASTQPGSSAVSGRDVTVSKDELKAETLKTSDKSGNAKPPTTRL